MRIEQLRRLATEAFGKNLEHATPANIREFLDSLQQADWRRERAAQGDADGVLDFTDASPSRHPLTWESQMRGFFSRALERSPDESAADLWLFALEMAYYGIEELNAERLDRLFQDNSES